MKKYETLADKIHIIRKKIQKEEEGLSDKEATEKTNKKAMEIAKKYGFEFQVKKNKSEYDIPEQQPLFINEDTPEDKGK